MPLSEARWRAILGSGAFPEKNARDVIEAALLKHHRRPLTGQSWADVFGDAGLCGLFSSEEPKHAKVWAALSNWGPVGPLRPEEAADAKAILEGMQAWARYGPHADEDGAPLGKPTAAAAEVALARAFADALAEALYMKSMYPPDFEATDTAVTAAKYLRDVLGLSPENAKMTLWGEALLSPLASPFPPYHDRRALYAVAYGFALGAEWGKRRGHEAREAHRDFRTNKKQKRKEYTEAKRRDFVKQYYAELKKLIGLGTRTRARRERYREARTRAAETLKWTKPPSRNALDDWKREFPDLKPTE